LVSSFISGTSNSMSTCGPPMVAPSKTSLPARRVGVSVERKSAAGCSVPEKLHALVVQDHPVIEARTHVEIDGQSAAQSRVRTTHCRARVDLRAEVGWRKDQMANDLARLDRVRPLDQVREFSASS
jgi:hypothetical protein